MPPVPQLVHKVALAAAEIVPGIFEVMREGCI